MRFGCSPSIVAYVANFRTTKSSIYSHKSTRNQPLWDQKLLLIMDLKKQPMPLISGWSQGCFRHCHRVAYRWPAEEKRKAIIKMSPNHSYSQTVPSLALLVSFLLVRLLIASTLVSGRAITRKTAEHRVWRDPRLTWNRDHFLSFFFFFVLPLLCTMICHRSLTRLVRFRAVQCAGIYPRHTPYFDQSKRSRTRVFTVITVSSP